MGKWKTVASVVFLAAAVGFGVFRWQASKQLDAAKQRIRDAGYPVTYLELEEYYAGAASGDNRAHLLQFAIDSMVHPDSSYSMDLPISGNVELPHRSEPIPDEQIAAMRTFSDHNADSIEAVFESFEIEECRFPVNISAGLTMELSHLAQMRSLGRQLSIESLLGALDGDTDRSTNALIGIFELADSLEHEPVLISQLVRLAIQGIGVNALEQAMNRADFSADQLDALQARVVEEEQNQGIRHGLIGERCGWASIETMGWRDNPFSNGGLDLQMILISLIYRPSGMMDLDAVDYYNYFDQILEANELPAHEQIDASRAIDLQIEQEGVGPMSAIFLPALARSLEAEVRIRAQLRAVTLALAAARYRTDHGAYPQDAEALVPDYLDTVPIDPSDGGTMRYRILDEGFVAYSLALNRSDEGGIENEDWKFWREGDLTFTVERKD
jgi:hypothetical protein